MKRWGVRCSVLAVLCATLFLPAAISAQEGPAAANAEQYREGLVHPVVKGDTLWDLSAKYLGSPWLWSELWERNRFITNPHYIYPGIKVVVFPPPPREYVWEIRETAPHLHAQPPLTTPPPPPGGGPAPGRFAAGETDALDHSGRVRAGRGVHAGAPNGHRFHQKWRAAQGRVFGGGQGIPLPRQGDPRGPDSRGVPRS